jgi:hypothetical protein
LALLILACGQLSPLPFGGTPVVALFAAISLWLRGEGARRVGLHRPPRWTRVVVFGLAGGVAYQAFSLFVLEPMTARLTGALPDVSSFAALRGNVRVLVENLAITLALVAFVEEFVYRGYFLNRLIQVLASSSRAPWIALGVTSAMFGSVHTYQGVAGVVDAGLMGLYLGTLYLLTKRNLWAPIIAHATIDTVGILLMFLGKYPGL